MPNVTSAPAPSGRYFRRQGVIRAVLQAGIVDPVDLRMLLQVARHGQGVLGVPLHAQVQRLGPLQQQEGVERRQARAGIAQPLHAGLDDERQRAERLGVARRRDTTGRAR